MKTPISWLENEIPAWIQESLISEKNAKILLAKYKSKTQTNVSLIIPLVLGSLLIGVGIISLLAYNWDGFSKIVKTFIVLVLLLSAQCGAFLVKLYKPNSPGANEGISLFWLLAFGSSFAIITQIYNLGGNFDDFLRALILFSLPTMYIFNSKSVAVALFIAIVYLVSFNNGHYYKNDLFYGHIFDYMLLLVWFPFYVLHLKYNHRAASSILLNTIFLIGMIFVVLSASSAGNAWVLNLITLLSVFWLTGALFEDKTETRHFELLSKIGILILLVFYCSFGAHHYYLETLNSLSYLLLALFFTLFAIFAILKREKFFEFLIPFSPMLFLVSYAYQDYSFVIFNASVVVGCVMMIVGGYLKSRLLLVNQGAAIILYLIATHFFESDLGLLWKGIIFILCGICFLFLNILIIKLQKRIAK